LLEAAASELGWEFRGAKVAQVDYRPGRSVVVQFRVDTGGTRPARETLVAAEGVRLPESVGTFSDGVRSIGVWRFPDDPFLPGLATARDPARVARLLAQIGVTTGEDLRVATRSYRPRHRAVIEVLAPPHRVFLKVVRPARIELLQRLHAVVADHVPVPHTLGWSADLGIVVLEAIAGTSLRHEVERGASGPSAEAIAALLDAIPPMAGARHVTGPAARAGGHARLLGAVVPEARSRLTEITRRLESAAGDAEVAVHGDLHSAQVMVNGPDLVGLVDIDTMGIGRRADDLATLLAHLAASSLRTGNPGAFNEYWAGLIGHFDRMTDPADLRLRVAGAAIGFATGPFRVQMKDWPTETLRRIKPAERWLASADGA
jgi:hypothetical protein